MRCTYCPVEVRQCTLGQIPDKLPFEVIDVDHFPLLTHLPRNGRFLIKNDVILKFVKTGLRCYLGNEKVRFLIRIYRKPPICVVPIAE